MDRQVRRVREARAHVRDEVVPHVDRDDLLAVGQQEARDVARAAARVEHAAADVSTHLVGDPLVVIGRALQARLDVDTRVGGGAHRDSQSQRDGGAMQRAGKARP